jgi:acetaldehyde dehydrogenase (acetylating)
MAIDRDLISIQEARDAVVTAHNAQRIWAKASQAEVDRVCAAMAEAAHDASERLGAMASSETGYGVPAHKKIKNQFAARHVWESIKDVKTVGVIRECPENKTMEIAWPVGVIAGLVPSTNPTSTIIYKALIALKARNAIIFSPHPVAVQCSVETAEILSAAAIKAGAPSGLISCLTTISLSGTQELMRHKYVALILATGGTPMVRAAHSVGKPAIGVGPGNVPVYVDRSADIERAARYIVSSKSFDYSTICATEQAVIADKPIAAKLRNLMEANGAYFVNPEQAQALRNLLFYKDGAINAATVGRSPQFLASQAGFKVPDSTRVLVAKLQEVGKNELLSREKLTTVLGWYEVDGWEEGCDRSIELIQFGGRGHTQVIHATDEKVIMAFGLEKPVFRIVVNTWGTLGAIGATTGVMPSLTLGAGGIGGSITGDNVTVHHLYNIKRLAFEKTPPPEAAFSRGENTQYPGSMIPERDTQSLEAIVREVMKEIMSQS